MSRFPQYGVRRAQPLDYAVPSDTASVATFFNAVYAWMAAGLAMTGVVAFLVSQNMAMMRQIFQPVVLVILVVAQLALVFTISAAIRKINTTVATLLFMLYAALMGLTLSAIFIVYTKASIAGTFAVTAGTFGAMSLYGFVTKRDLSRLGSILFMALIGLIIASIVNVFWANSTFYWIITYAGVLIFVGLTAYDTQKLKEIAYQTADDPHLAGRLAVSGALVLYLDFINLFLFLLRILGRRE